MVRVGLLVGLSCGWLACGIGGTFGGAPKPNPNLSKRLVEDSAPAAPDPGVSTRDALRVVELHVYADQDYRREVGQWQSRFRVLVKRANTYLEPAVGVRLVADRFSPWTRRSSPEQRGQVLEELVSTEDAAAQVVVVGLVTNMTMAVTSFDEIGAAHVGGSHMFMRNLNDGEEYARFAAARPRMSDEDKQREYDQRKTHMEVLVLLHELGHIFGVEHEREPGTIMYPSYSKNMRAYSDEAATSIRRNLIARVDDAQREHQRRRADAAAREQLDDLGYRLDGVAKLATDADKRQALAALEQDMPANGAGPMWARLAVAYQQLDAVSAAARAAEQAGDDAPAPLLRWLAQTRARFALPPEGAPHAVDPASEPEYMAVMREVVRDTARSDLAAARARIATARKRFASAPGIDMVLCDLDVRQSKWKRAKKRCAAALRRYDGASWAHYLASMIAVHERDVAAARTHLERAIELDPDLSVARDRLRQLPSK
jgi:tetratricopeptide (TPR) repeat protein